ncbi:MAG: alpha-L-rhamnosidase, partial [Planctomycetes bacterium]|nr:alpha-L-rhamnosidase [Planctomycetota bacterium]
MTGLPAKPALDSLTGRVFHSAAPEVGHFECSEPLLNKLWQNIFWTQRANMHSTPTDCPQRDERCGWMGDILAFAPTACFNMDMAAFFTKWIPDTRDAQADDGRFADFSPQPFDPNARFSGVPAWGDAGVFVPWVAYQYYGDKRLLAEQYDAAVKWIEFVRSKNPDLLWKNARGNDYGDWLNADTLQLAGWPKKGAEVPKHVFATAFFARSTETDAQMASVLGRNADADKYAK